MRKLLFIILLITFLYGKHSYAQNGPENTDAVLLQFNYGICFPTFDLNKRYGYFFSIGTTPVVYFHTPKLTVGGDFHYYFGRRIKIDAMDNLRDDYGQIIGSNTQAATVVQRMRGIRIGVHFSKIYDLSSTPSVSGIESGITVGYLQHWIRLQDDSETAAQLLGEYEKGYDRLTGGIYLEPHLAYTYMSADGRINIKGGVKFNIAFTRSLRKYNYDTGMPDTDARLDGFYTLFINYSLPIYFRGRNASQYYY